MQHFDTSLSPPNSSFPSWYKLGFQLSVQFIGRCEQSSLQKVLSACYVQGPVLKVLRKHEHKIDIYIQPVRTMKEANKRTWQRIRVVCCCVRRVILGSLPFRLYFNWDLKDESISPAQNNTGKKGQKLSRGWSSKCKCAELKKNVMCCKMSKRRRGVNWG